MDPTTVERLIQSHFDRTITPAERQQLEQLLLDEPETCQRFWEEARWHLLMHTAVESKGETVEESEVPASRHLLQPPSAFSLPKGSLLRFLTHSLPQALHPRHHTARFAATVTILTATFWAVLFALVWNRDRADFPGEKTQHVATITHAKDAVWTEGQVGPHRGAHLAAGRRLDLERGFIHLEFRDGARVVIEGPAVLRVDAPGVMTLDRGRLLAHVPERAIGFTVETSTLDIIDLGTEFGVEVREENTEVQVFQGRVQVQGLNDIRDSARVMVAGQAAVFGISSQQGFYVKEKKMNRAIYLGLAAVLAMSAPEASQAVLLVQPTVVTASSQFEAARNPDNTRDNSGLSSAIATGAPVPGTYPTHSTSHLDMWLATSADSAGTPTITFDLGSEYLLGGLHYWNQNEGSATRGIRNVDVEFSTTSAVAGFGSLESYSGASEFSQAPGLSSYTGEDKMFSSSITARWVRFTIDSNWGDTFTGLSEVRFITADLPPVPEPATGSLLGLGGMMVVGFARKRRRLRARK